MKRTIIANTMNSDDNKVFISKNLKISDKSLENAIREILFDSENVINWDRAVEAFKQNMPELNNQSLGIMNNLANGVGGLSSIYDIIQVDDRFILIEPWEHAKHGDCIQFVDEVVRLLNCEFSRPTSRGGSWTKWTLTTDTGVRLKAGWSNDFDARKFNVPEDKWIVELA